ncbi:MAG: hypothetical protein QXS20_06665 [Candidatus Thorarchaeota archaeon]
MAPLKDVLESDAVRSRVLRLLIEDGGWVSTSDLIRVARQVRPVLGAVTIGTMLNRINEVAGSRFILSRASLTSGFEWSEWRINPECIEAARKLLQMVSRSRLHGDRRTAQDEPVSPFTQKRVVTTN